MLWFHPLLQAVATLLGTYALWLGFARFQSLHLKRMVPFDFKGHVRVGLAAVLVWLFGAFGGAYMTKSTWFVVGITGLHYTVAQFMIPMLVFGLVSGVILWRWRKPRFWLPLVHAINNVVLFMLAIWQGITGWGIIRDFLLN